MRLKMLAHIADVRGYFAAEEAFPPAAARQARVLAEKIFESCRVTPVTSR